jgi:hypothetical protein
MSNPRIDPEHESRQSLWRPISAPIIWGVHFMLTYLTAAIWCAKVAGRDGPLGGARLAIAVYTLVALAGITAVGWRGWQRHTFDGSVTNHDFDSPADRHRFLGFATTLLAGLSAVGTLLTALAVAFFSDCR